MRTGVQLTRKKVQPGGAGGRTYLYWVLRWHDPISGKKLSETLGRADDRRHRGWLPRREAELRRQAKATQLASNPRTRGRSPTLEQWLSRFVQQRQIEEAAEKTIEGYEYAGRLVCGYFGADRRLDQVDATEARGFMTALLSGELTAVKRCNGKCKGICTCHLRRGPPGIETAKKTIRGLRAIWGRAIADRLLSSGDNPWTGLMAMSPAAAEWRYVPPDEFLRMLAECEGPRAEGQGPRDENPVAHGPFSPGPTALSMLLCLCRLAALSREDALRLRWRDVDLARGEISIKRVKTGAEQRPPINAELRERLIRWRETRAAIGITSGGGDERVIDEREIVGRFYLSKLVRKVCVRAGVPGYGKPLHSLRQSCITDWIGGSGGGSNPPHVVQLWAGHKNVTTTLKFYSKVQPADMQRGREQVMLSPGA